MANVMVSGGGPDQEGRFSFTYVPKTKSGLAALIPEVSGVKLDMSVYAVGFVGGPEELERVIRVFDRLGDNG